jgi:hypothetical protein
MHRHAGNSDYTFRVRNPETILDTNDDEWASKQFAAIPFSLFDATRTALQNIDTGLRTDITALQIKTNRINPTADNLLVGAISATGDIVTTKLIKARYAGTNCDITIGGADGSTSYDITVSDASKPVNIKTENGLGNLELQVNGAKVWTNGNHGPTSGLSAQLVGGKVVNDEGTTNESLWTAKKVIDYVEIEKPTSVENARLFNGFDVNKFVMVSDGVNVQNIVPVVKAIYPVGSIYISTTATRPELIFDPLGIYSYGWTWEELPPGKVLLSAGVVPFTGETYTLGDIGGATSTTLTSDQLPSHQHHFFADDQVSAFYTKDVTYNYDADSRFSGSAGSYRTKEFETRNNPHSNMQPYLVVKMWVRKS